MTKPKEAPWLVIEQEVTLSDGITYRLYWLGETGKDKLKNAVCKDQFNDVRWHFEEDIRKLKSMLKVLTDIIGGPPAMVEYFKGHILVQIGKKSCRTGVLTSEPYMSLKYQALQELLDQGKVVHTRNGWWKLGKI